MMREIKFRAWHKERKIMTDPFDIWMIDRDESFRTYLPDIGRCHEDDVTIMQYTGLKDKNGVKIFDGDIIRFRDDRWNDESPTPTSICLVRWRGKYPEWALPIYIDDYNGERFVNYGTDTHFYRYWLKEYLEIIGNIYQHSHLLEATK